MVTLASNLECESKGGKATSIVTSFSKEKVKWENIIIQGEEESTEKNDDEEDKNQKESLDNLSSKLASIIYGDNIIKSWLGVEGGKKEDFEGRDNYVTFSFKEGTNNNNITIDGKENDIQPKLREIYVGSANPFLDVSKKEEIKDVELISQSPGSPLYYRDYNYDNRIYSIAIITENFEYQYFDKKIMNFLVNIVNKGKQFIKKINNTIDTNSIVQLNLEAHNFGPSDINYLINNFSLKNLKILDLNSNSIKSKGAFYLSQSKFNSLEFLNLSDNTIGDEGLNYISKGFFNKLNTLHLTHNSITSEGIKYLVKAEFLNNLIILTLSENRKIGDTGVRYMKEHKEWKNLKILSLNRTGLTDYALEYFMEANMPNLKRLNIRDNKFTEFGKPRINALRMNHIYVNYKPGDKSKDLIIPDEEEELVIPGFTIPLK